MERSEKVFTFIAIFFCVNLVITNIVAVKLWSVPLFPSIALAGGEFLYPITFLITDIVAEIWGKKRADFIVYSGFAMNVFMILAANFVISLSPHPFWYSPENSFGFTEAAHYQNAFESVFNMAGILVVASSVAYMIAQLMDIRIFHFFKKLTKGKHLWLRNNASTMTSQLIDSTVFVGIYFYWGLGKDFHHCLEIWTYMYLFKVLFALCDTPFCYLGVSLVRKMIGKETENTQLATAAT